MSWLSPFFTIQDAITAKQPTWDLLVDQWGMAPTFGGEIQFPLGGSPGIIAPIAGIAIGPRSTVDRAWVSWNMQKTLQPGVAAGLLRRVSRDSPLLFSIPTKLGTIANPDPAEAMSKGALYIFPHTKYVPGFPPYDPFPDPTDTTIPADSYFKADPSGGNQVQEFLAANGSLSIFEAPLLHLIFYLQAPFLPLPAKRFPYTTKGGPIAVLSGPGEGVIAQIPTYGRKHIAIEMVASKQASFRVGALRAGPFGPNFLDGSAAKQTETTEAGATGVAQNTSTLLELCEPNADYIILYCTPSADCNVSFTVAAYD